MLEKGVSDKRDKYHLRFYFSDNSPHFNSTPNWTQGPSQRGWRGSPNTFRNFTPRGGGGSGGGRGFTPRGGMDYQISFRNHTTARN